MAMLEPFDGGRKGAVYTMSRRLPSTIRIALRGRRTVLYAKVPRSPRTGETPEQILDRLAKELGCEPRQVCDRVIAMLEERRKNAKSI